MPRVLPGLSGLSLEYGVTGLLDLNNVGIPDLDTVRIRQMTQNGIQARPGATNSSTWTFHDVQISQTGGFGALLDTAGFHDTPVFIEEMVIEETWNGSTECNPGRTEDLTIRNSTFITTSTGDTVYLEGGRNTALEKITISRPYFWDGHALHKWHGDKLTVLDSTITGGNYSISASVISDVTISRNHIAYGNFGIYAVSSYAPMNLLIENNRISQTGYDGVNVSGFDDLFLTMRYNDLYNIARYKLYNQSDSPIDASDNYWGEDTVAEMIAEGCDSDIEAIYDWYNRSTKGLVTYCPFSTEPFGDQAAIYFHKNGSSYEIHWNPKSDMTYDLIRGDLADLAVAVDTIDLGPVTCETMADGTGKRSRTSVLTRPPGRPGSSFCGTTSPRVNMA